MAVAAAVAVAVARPLEGAPHRHAVRLGALQAPGARTCTLIRRLHTCPRRCSEFHFRGPSNRLIRDKGEEDSQFEGIAYVPENDTFLLLKEARMRGARCWHRPGPSSGSLLTSSRLPPPPRPRFRQAMPHGGHPHFHPHIVHARLTPDGDSWVELQQCKVRGGVGWVGGGEEGSLAGQLE